MVVGVSMHNEIDGMQNMHVLEVG
jgi:hypothetical protein